MYHVHCLTCSENNFAEMFFAEMSEKNGASYDALISGLVKVGENCHVYDRVINTRASVYKKMKCLWVKMSKICVPIL